MSQNIVVKHHVRKTFKFVKGAKLIIKRSLRVSGKWPQWIPFSFQRRHIQKNGGWTYDLYCGGCTMKAQTKVKVRCTTTPSMVSHVVTLMSSSVLLITCQFLSTFFLFLVLINML